MCLSVASMVLSRPDANVLAASGACIAWPNLLSYLRGYRFCGALLRMMIEITREAGPFMLVMLVWTLGFSTGKVPALYMMTGAFFHRNRVAVCVANMVVTMLLTLAA